MRTQHHNQRGAPAHHSARKLGGSDEDPAQPKMNKKQDLRKKKTTVWNQEAPTLQERHNQDAPSYVFGLPWWLSGKESACNVGDLGWIPGSDPWVWKIPWRRAWQPTPVFLSGESHGQRSLVGCSPWGHKESDTTERLSARIHTHTHTHTRSHFRTPMWDTVSSFSQKAQRKSTKVSSLKIKSKITTTVY